MVCKYSYMVDQFYDVVAFVDDIIWIDVDSVKLLECIPVSYS